MPEPLATMITNPVARDDAVAALRGYSLIEVIDDLTLSVHRLVQFVARERLPQEDRQRWAAMVVRTVNAAIPNEAHDVRGWPVAARLLPHGLATVALAEELGVEDAASGQSLNRVGRYLTGRALYAQALEALERALAIREAALGPDHPDAALGLSNLGSVLRAQGDLTGAREHFEQSLRIREAALGPDHPDVVLGLSNLGTVLQDQGEALRTEGEFGRARQALQQALGFSEESTIASMSRRH